MGMGQRGREKERGKEGERGRKERRWKGGRTEAERVGGREGPTYR